MTEMETGSELKTVTRAAAVLKAFLDQDAWGVTALARHLGLNKTVVHRLLQTLASAGFVAVQPGTSTYVLGPVARRLGERAQASDDLVRLARPLMQDICRQTSETVSLVVVRGFEGYCLESLDSPQAMRMTFHRGERFPLNAGAVGKTLLAFRSDSFVNAYLASGSAEAITPNTITDPKAIRAEVLRIRAQGYGDSDSEITPGARSVGVPVWGDDDDAIAAIVISAPAFRLQGRAAEDAIALLRSAAGRLSAGLGYRAAVPRKQAS